MVGYLVKTARRRGGGGLYRKKRGIVAKAWGTGVAEYIIPLPFNIQEAVRATNGSN